MVVRVLLDFDSQLAFSAGDEGRAQWPPPVVRRAAVLCEIFNVFSKNTIHVSENKALASYMNDWRD